MGWTTGRRSEVVAEEKRTKQYPGGVTREVVAHHASGNEDWFQVRVTNADGVRSRYILLIVWEGGWFKEMTEDVHPYYYGCPVEWFKAVPCPSSKAAEWRAFVTLKQTDPNLNDRSAAARYFEERQRIASGKAPA